MSKRLKSYYDFRGGLNTDAAPDNLLDNEMVQADNVDLEERGGITKRRGTERLNETAYGAQVEQIFEWPRDDGTFQLMAVVGDTLCKIAEDGTKTDVVQVASRRVGHFFWQDKLYFADGGTFRVYDGSTVQAVGGDIPEAPSTQPTISSNTGSNKTMLKAGTYKAAVTFAGAVETLPGSKIVVPRYESEPSDIVEFEVSDDGDEITWTNIPTGPSGTVARALYRSRPFSDQLYLVAVIEDNSTTTYTDSRDESELTYLLRDDADLTPIHKCKYLVRHTNSQRIFASGNPEDPTALYYSEPGEPYRFLRESVLYPTTADGPVMGLIAFGDALVVLFRHSKWAWRGIDPMADATWTKAPTGVGTPSEATAALTPNTLTFLGEGGIYAVSPAILGYDVTIEPGEGIVTNFAENKVQNLLRNIGSPELATAVYDSRNQRYLLAYTEGTAVRNNRILVLDWNLRAFTRYTNISANDLCYRQNGEVIVASNNYILRMDRSSSDPGDAPIPMHVRTKQYNLDFPFHRKRLLRLYMAFFQPDDGTSVVTLRVYMDGIVRAEFVESSLYENFVWGESEWGEGIWGFVNLVTTRTRIAGAGGHRVQVELLNDQAGIPTVVYGLAFEFRPVRPKGERL